MTDQNAELLLLAADITPDAARVKELKLWAAILERGLKGGGGDADIMITEALKLRGVGDERIEEALQLLNSDGDTDGAIGAGGTPGSATRGTTDAPSDSHIESLVALLENGDEDEHYLAAVVELGRLGDVRAVQRLLEEWDVLDEEQLQQVVLPVIARIGQKAVPALLDITQDTQRENELRLAAAIALGTVGHAPAADAIATTLSDMDPENTDRETELRLAAAIALGRMGDARAADAIDACLSHLDDYSDCHKAAELAIALVGQCGSARQLNTLLTIWAYDDKLSDVVEDALRNLDLLSVETLGPFLLDGDNWQLPKQSAAQLLAKYGGSDAVEPLIKSLADREGEVVWSSTIALSWFGDPCAIEPIIAGLDSAETDLAADDESIPRALARFGELAVQPLCKALSNPGLGRRSKVFATQALELIGDLRSVGPLVVALQDPDNWVRYYAARALGTIGDRQAVMPLVDALEDSDAEVASQARKALRQIGDGRNPER